MSAFNEFTEAFDRAAAKGDAKGAEAYMLDYVRRHSQHTHKTLKESFDITLGWMGYDAGENRAADERNSPTGKKAIAAVLKSIGQ